MDNDKNLQPEREDDWVDQVLENPDETNQELNPDESTIYASGFTRPEDIELEKIILEAKAMDEPAEETPAEDDIQSMIAEDLSIDSFIAGFRLAWKLSQELTTYEKEHPISTSDFVE